MVVNPMIDATIRYLFITIDVIEPLGLFNSSTMEDGNNWKSRSAKWNTSELTRSTRPVIR